MREPFDSLITPNHQFNLSPNTPPLGRVDLRGPVQPGTVSLQPFTARQSNPCTFLLYNLVVGNVYTKGVVFLEVSAETGSTLIRNKPPQEKTIDPVERPPKKKPLGRGQIPRENKQQLPNEEELRVMEKQHKKQESLKKFRDEFKERGVLKAMFGAVETKVQSACMSTDHLLQQRQTRLRELLLAEEVAYTSEYVAKCQQANADREEELRRVAFELQAKIERERKQFADEKLLQQKVMSCDPARPTLTQKQLREVKQDQLWQIREKYALEEARREEEKMYHDLMMKNILAMKENEEEIAKLAWKRQKDAQKAFAEQMKWKEMKEEQERRLKEFERVQLEEEVRSFKADEAKAREEKQQKKEKMKAEFRELLEREREIKERRRREEEEIERAFNELLKLEAEKEKRKEASNKERLKREMDSFIEKSKELKRQQEEEEKKCDQMLQELNEKKRQQKDAERRRLRDAKEELFQSVLKTREEQIKEKQIRERREAERERAEIELLTAQLEQQDKIRADYERRCAEQRIEYKCQLLRQIEEANEAKRKKKEDEQEFLRQMKEKEEKEIEEVKEILRMVPVYPKDHPMKIVTREQHPRYPCLHPYM